MEPEKVKRWKVLGATTVIAAGAITGGMIATSGDDGNGHAARKSDAAVIRVASVNIGRHAPRKECAAPEKVKREVRADLIGLQEIGEADNCDERSAVRRAWQPPWRITGMYSHTPVITNDTDWIVRRSWSIRAMKGIPRVSPNRYIVARRVTHRQTRQTVTLINTHMIANPTTNKRRWNLWRGHWQRMMRIAYREQDKGRHVLLTGDHNLHNLPSIECDGQIVMHRRVDHIIALPADGYDVEVLRRNTVKLGIDGHAALSADVRFVKR